MEQLEIVFPGWYSIVDPNRESSHGAARLAAIADITKALTMQGVPQLTRLFYRLPVSPDTTEIFRKALQTRDESYDAKDDDAELAIIAGGVIYASLARSSNVADAVALAVVCADCAGLRKTPRVNDVVDACRQYVANESLRIREKGPKLPSFAPDTYLTGIKALQPHYAVGLPTYGAALDDVLGTIVSALGTYAKELGTFLTHIETSRREESNIISWLLRGSTDQHCSYSSVDVKRASLLIAKELANLTEFTPGPPSIRAFIRKMLVCTANFKDAKVTISECVAALDRAEREAIASEYPSKDATLMPILFAISKAQESGGTGWTAAFSAQTLLDIKNKLEPMSIAEQFYSELLLWSTLS